jgi:predicted RNA binding protein YcfA (HicA-like mRNA interferase family)
MGSREKLLDQITGGRSDANVTFDDLCNLLIYLGFEMRTRGSHHIFRKTGIAERINLQRDGTNAKPYQVRQVRNIVLKYRLGAED